MRRDFQQFVERSLRALQHEAPMFHLQLCKTVDGLRLCITSEGEPFALHFDGGAVASLRPHGSEEVHLHVDGPTILALVDGELTLEDALRQDRLELRGSPTHVQHFFDGLVVYVRGGIRCPSFPQLISDFRAS